MQNNPNAEEPLPAMKNHVLIFIAVSVAAAVLACGAADQTKNVITLKPGKTPVVVEKLAVTDSRVVRGFRGTSVDGTLLSFDFMGYLSEYPDSVSEGFDASSGVDYAWNDNDGLHIAFDGSDGFDAVILRGGATASMYAGNTSLTEPSSVQPLTSFGGARDVEERRFGKRIPSERVSFFSVKDGSIADVGFFRIGSTRPSGTIESWYHGSTPADLPEPDEKFAPGSVKRSLEKLYGVDARAVSFGKASSGGGSIDFTAGIPVNFISPPVGQGTGLDAVGMAMKIDAPGAFVCTAVLHDPLDPALDLEWFRFTGTNGGDYHIVLDAPDQVLAPEDRLWLTLSFDNDVTLGGPDGSPRFDMYFTTESAAMTEALAHRKFLLKTFFALLSECRPWGSYRDQSRDEFFSINEFTALCPQLFMTIDRCHMLAPEDSMVRQYREWVFLNHLKSKGELSEVAPPEAPPAGVPEWAWYPRAAWLEARNIAVWWLENRLVPNGEFGGKVSDDSDLYQQFSDMPYLESDGVAELVLDGAARLAELAERDHLRDGLNLLTCDTLHAYEEGINHMAIMARWFYGDPIYLERCMVSARNMEKLTVVTPDGRRHFRDRRAMGHIDLTQPHEPTIDGHATALMWHTSLQAADYNRNPLALKTMREWADTWLRFQKPGQWATDIEVMTGKVLASSKDRPLYGGYRTQACVFAWLYGLTGEAKYLEPFMYYYRRGEAPPPSDAFLNDSYSMGLLKSLPAGTIDTLARRNPLLAAFRTGDAASLVQNAIGGPVPGSAQISTLYDMKRWPMMYTSAEQFTDRLFTSILETASLAYLGGATQRNRFDPTHAVGWSGFGTDYAALVTDNRKDGFSVMVYSFADTAMNGAMQVWNIDHGRYRVTIGPDGNGDGIIDGSVSGEILELAKADTVPVTLAPKSVTLIEVEQVEKLDSIFTRADLALAGRELRIEGANVHGIAHNIGSAGAADVVVAVLDADGSEVARKSLGALDAPLDLVPRTTAFTVELSAPPADGWKIVLDPDNALPEIYEGNNTVEIGSIFPPDYSNGWE